MNMRNLHRITFDPNMMGGKPCIRGMRVTLGMIVGLLATGHSKAEIPKLYPYLESGDIDEALSYRHLIEQFNYTQEQAAEAVGKSRTVVTNKLRIC